MLKAFILLGSVIWPTDYYLHFNFVASRKNIYHGFSEWPQDIILLIPKHGVFLPYIYFEFTEHIL